MRNLIIFTEFQSPKFSFTRDTDKNDVFIRKINFLFKVVFIQLSTKLVDL